MDNILQIVRQEDVENRFNRKLIDTHIRNFITGDINAQEKILKGVEILTEWLEGTYYESKMDRIAPLKQLDLNRIVEDTFVHIAYVQTPQQFTGVTAALAERLGFDDKRDAIQTTAEMVATLADTDAYDIIKRHRDAPLEILNRLKLPDEIVVFINQSHYMPPMVCEPLELENNYDSGYLTIKESLISGKGNHHDGNICLDVLNTLNKVKLKLDMDFLLSVEEEPSKEFTVERVIKDGIEDGKYHTEAQAAVIVKTQLDNWHHFKPQSEKIYKLMYDLGNEFYLTHKVDKRGRIYAQGYHISTQSTPYKKAMVELANEELVTGI